MLEAPVAVEQVRTIFISGFPADVKERELNNLMRWLGGYQAGQMNFKQDKNGQLQPQGFALFASNDQAQEAISKLNGFCFDLDGPYLLRCEMARKNMYIGMKDAESGAQKRVRANGEGLAPGAHHYGFQANGAYPKHHPHGKPSTPIPDDNPPCNTLFVGNLGDSIQETDLHGVFGELPGFKQLKLVRSGRNFTCFVEFSDIPSATAAKGRLHGCIITGCGRGGIRIQFSKNPFGKKRGGWDGAHHQHHQHHQHQEAHGNGRQLPPPITNGAWGFPSSGGSSGAAWTGWRPARGSPSRGRVLELRQPTPSALAPLGAASPPSAGTAPPRRSGTGRRRPRGWRRTPASARSRRPARTRAPPRAR